VVLRPFFNYRNMDTEYIQKEIEKFKQAIADDEHKQALIDQNIRYHKRQLKNAESALKELQESLTKEKE
jgi:septal ring factor EnvC (AmiA/AmiB activator)